MSEEEKELKRRIEAKWDWLPKDTAELGPKGWRGMSTKTLYMETTEIAPERTAGEISALLVGTGAREISMQYEAGKITGIRFTLDIAGAGRVHFAMPVRVEPIYQILVKRSRSTWLSDDEKRKRAQAERVAWRQLLRWTQAQLAMIDVGMVAAREVFLPYALDHSGRTLFEYFDTLTQKG